MPENLLETPLADRHRALGAKMSMFAGWNMPTQYEGVIAEHIHTRSAASLFDTSHMGEILVHGPGASAVLDRAISHNIKNLTPGKCRYGFLLNEHGCIIDDLILYNLGRDRFMLAVNAAGRKRDVAVLSSRLPDNIKAQDITAATAKLDLQGPLSIDVLQNLLAIDLKSLKYFNFREAFFRDEKLLVSRSGFTGELGYEIYLPWDKAGDLWDALLKDERVKPAGMGARDTLRLESGFSRHTHEFDGHHTPAEAGLGHFLTSTAAYVGRDEAMSVCQSLVPLRLADRRTARHGDIVASPDDGKVIGQISSATFAPSLGCGIALAWIAPAEAGNDDFIIRAARAQLPAKRVALPFYREGTARIKFD